MTKQKLLYHTLRAGILTASLCLIYGFFIEPKTLAVRHVEIGSKNWQGPPLTIGLMADIHIGGMHVSAQRVAKIADAMNALNPDIILLAGDYVNGHIPYKDRPTEFTTEIEQGMKNLGRLKAPLGVFAALGNHDSYYGPLHIDDMLTEVGINVLENEHHILNIGTHDFCLIGLADYLTGTEDKRVFGMCDLKQNIIAIMHSPDSFSILPDQTILALAGHTHGGQINIPLIGRRVTATNTGRKYAYGVVNYDVILGFVTAGIGTSILPARFRSPPEIVVITLRSPSPQAQSVLPK